MFNSQQKSVEDLLLSFAFMTGISYPDERIAQKQEFLSSTSLFLAPSFVTKELQNAPMSDIGAVDLSIGRLLLHCVACDEIRTEEHQTFAALRRSR